MAGGGLYGLLGEAAGRLRYLRSSIGILYGTLEFRGTETLNVYSHHALVLQAFAEWANLCLVCTQGIRYPSMLKFVTLICYIARVVCISAFSHYAKESSRHEKISYGWMDSSKLTRKI